MMLVNGVQKYMMSSTIISIRINYLFPSFRVGNMKLRRDAQKYLNIRPDVSRARYGLKPLAHEKHLRLQFSY